MNKLIKVENFTNEQGVEMARKYFGQDEEHISVVIEELVSPQIEEKFQEEISQDELNAEIILSQSMIIAKQAEQDEVLAEILLHQTKMEE